MSTTPPPDNQDLPAYPGPSSEPPPQTGAGGYPVHPGTPSGGTGGGHPGMPGAEVPRPAPMRTAVRLMWVGAVITGLSVIVSLATLGSVKDDIAERLRDDDPNVSQSTIDAAFAVGVVFALIVGAVGIFLWLWMAWKNGQGRSWARVVATVLAGLNVLFTLLSFLGDGQTTAGRIFSIINLLLAIAILVLIWRKESSDFYAARSRPQHG